MNNDDFDSQEIFDGSVEISSLERGSTFGLDGETYYRMARCAMDCAAMRIAPAMIRKLPGGESGCKLVLWGRTHQFSIRVRALRSGATIDVFAEPLDGALTCWIPLYSGTDCDPHWSRALRSMLAVEGTHYVDQYWAQEQAEQGDGEATT